GVLVADGELHSGAVGDLPSRSRSEDRSVQHAVSVRAGLGILASRRVRRVPDRRDAAEANQIPAARLGPDEGNGAAPETLLGRSRTARVAGSPRPRGWLL